MSDSHSHSHHKPVRNPKDPKLQKGKVTSYATETDLWNFDDDLTAEEVVTLPVEKVTTATKENEPAIEEDVPFAEVENPATNVEVNTIEAAPVVKAQAEVEEVTPLRVRPVEVGLTEKEIWDDFVDDEAPAATVEPESSKTKEIAPPVKVEATPVKKESVNLAVPEIKADAAQETEVEEVTPLRVRPVEVGLTEEEIWDDFVDDEAPAVTVEPESSKTKEIAPPAKVEATPVKVAPSPAKEPVKTEVTEIKADAPQEVEPTEKAEENELETAPAPAAAPATVQITKFSKIEIYSSFAFLFLLIVGGFFALHIFRKNTAGNVDPYALPNLPAKGSIAQVAKIETYWRTPIKDGPNRDHTKLDVKLIPCVDITLASGKSAQGALRVMFVNDKGDIVGDTVTRVFQNHSFVDNQSATIAFSSSAGFSDFGEQEAYRARIGKPWTVKIYEGPSDTAPSESFSLLLSSPISIDRR